MPHGGAGRMTHQLVRVGGLVGDESEESEGVSKVLGAADRVGGVGKRLDGVDPRKLHGNGRLQFKSTEASASRQAGRVLVGSHAKCDRVGKEGKGLRGWGWGLRAGRILKCVWWGVICGDGQGTKLLAPQHREHPPTRLSHPERPRQTADGRRGASHRGHRARGAVGALPFAH